MKKTVSFQGEQRTNVELREALELANAVTQSLADGKSEFVLDYEKKDGSSTLSIRTIAKRESKPKIQTLPKDVTNEPS